MLTTNRGLQNDTGPLHAAVSVLDLSGDPTDAFNPSEEIIQIRRQIPFGSPAKRAKPFDTRNTVAIVAAPILTCDGEPDVPRKFRTDQVCKFENRGGPAASNVERLKIRFILLQNKHVGVHHIGNVNKVSSLQAVFVDNEWLSLERPAGKNAADA